MQSDTVNHFAKWEYKKEQYTIFVEDTDGRVIVDVRLIAERSNCSGRVSKKCKALVKDAFDKVWNNMALGKLAKCVSNILKNNNLCYRMRVQKYSYLYVISKEAVKVS